MIFSLNDQFKRSIRLTKERYIHIIERPEMINQEDKIWETIVFPEIIKESKRDSSVLCYYRYYDKTPVTHKYLVCIVKVLNDEGFVVTAFYADKIKEGKTVWQR